jgi:ribulose-5-phosphate 4-epimerase/fuculose-1-phosphate aldolase
MSAAHLQAARERLVAKGLLQDGDSLSCLLPADGGVLSLVQGSDGAQAPILHRQLYAARLDAGAALLARLPWASALAHSGETMPGVFDEQLRHLGAQVRAVETVSTAALADGANAYLTPEGVLCIGMTLERLVFNAELLEKCAKAFVLARVGGQQVRKIPWLVRWIATGRLRRDQRSAAEHHARGEEAPRTAGY